MYIRFIRSFNCEDHGDHFENENDNENDYPATSSRNDFHRVSISPRRCIRILSAILNRDGRKIALLAAAGTDLDGIWVLDIE